MTANIDMLDKIEHRDDCWIWTGVVCGGKCPTATLNVSGKKLNVKRVLFERENGPLGKERIRCTCGEKLCVNPAHYELIERKGKKKKQKPKSALLRVKVLARRCGYRLVRIRPGAWRVERATTTWQFIPEYDILFMTITVVDCDGNTIEMNERIAAIIEWLLSRSERINQLRTGSVELHFGDEQISAKIIENETVK